MTDSVITANNNMSYYAGEDSRLGDLFIESINNFENEIMNKTQKNCTRSAQRQNTTTNNHERPL